MVPGRPTQGGRAEAAEKALKEEVPNAKVTQASDCLERLKRIHLNVDPGLIKRSHFSGGVPSKSGLNPTTKRGHPPIKINQGFINPGLTLNHSC